MLIIDPAITSLVYIQLCSTGIPGDQFKSDLLTPTVPLRLKLLPASVVKATVVAKGKWAEAEL